MQEGSVFRGFEITEGQTLNKPKKDYLRIRLGSGGSSFLGRVVPRHDNEEDAPHLTIHGGEGLCVG